MSHCQNFASAAQPRRSSKAHEQSACHSRVKPDNDYVKTYKNTTRAHALEHSLRLSLCRGISSRKKLLCALHIIMYRSRSVKYVAVMNKTVKQCKQAMEVEYYCWFQAKEKKTFAPFSTNVPNNIFLYVKVLSFYLAIHTQHTAVHRLNR